MLLSYPTRACASLLETRSHPPPSLSFILTSDNHGGEPCGSSRSSFCNCRSNRRITRASSSKSQLAITLDRRPRFSRKKYNLLLGLSLSCSANGKNGAEPEAPASVSSRSVSQRCRRYFNPSGLDSGLNSGLLAAGVNAVNVLAKPNT
jgi:hypothetical protein